MQNGSVMIFVLNHFLKLEYLWRYTFLFSFLIFSLDFSLDFLILFSPLFLRILAIMDSQILFFFFPLMLIAIHKLLKQFNSDCKAPKSRWFCFYKVWSLLYYKVINSLLAKIFTESRSRTLTGVLRGSTALHMLQSNNGTKTHYAVHRNAITHARHRALNTHGNYLLWITLHWIIPH